LIKNANSSGLALAQPNADDEEAEKAWVRFRTIGNMTYTGATAEEILRNYPFLEPEDVQACVAYALYDRGLFRHCGDGGTRDGHCPTYMGKELPVEQLP
jgi:hypothetical protein